MRKPSGFQVKQSLCARTQRGADTPQRGGSRARLSRRFPTFPLRSTSLETAGSVAGDGWDVTAVPPPKWLHPGGDGNLG